ncbi:MAG: folylpolyglutamate synthase/dihydrofolate synthase family protein [Crocinitomicaceae bacterium]
MNYRQVVEWLFNQLANYHKQGSAAYKPGLENITNLLKEIGNPQEGLKCVHIAGTNGKGSTAHMVAAMAIENGYKVGLFTSPHIKDFRERIRINGQMIDESFVVNFVNSNKEIFEKLNPSFFEITTAMAFKAFASCNCDYAIIETGLGGRLDATNVINPLISVITNIGIDHTEFLGDTLEQIAAEKAGIIKKDTPTLIGEILPETEYVFRKRTEQMNSAIYRPAALRFKLDLLGSYQQRNANTAWKTLQVLKEKGYYFDDKKSVNALKRVHKLTGFSGRLMQISSNPAIIVDASHNPDGIQMLMREIESVSFENLHCVFGAAADKDYELSMSYFPKNATYYLTTFNSKRAAKLTDLSAIAKNLSLNYSLYPEVQLALETAKSHVNPDDLILVFGSFYILEKII